MNSCGRRVRPLHSSSGVPWRRDLAVDQEAREVRDAERAGHVVRDDHVGDLEEIAHLFDEVVDHARGVRVEPAGRLVVDQNRRLEHERARQADALAHAARELRREQLLGACEPQELELLGDLRRGSRSRELGVLAQGERDVVHDVERIEQRGVLKDHPELSAHRFSSTSSSGRRCLRRRRRCAPRSAVEARSSSRMRVVLPAPDPPKMTVVWPRGMTRSMSRSTSFGPKRLETCSSDDVLVVRESPLQREPAFTHGREVSAQFRCVATSPA